MCSRLSWNLYNGTPILFLDDELSSLVPVYLLCCVVLYFLCYVVLCCGNMRGMVSQAGAPSIVSWQPNAPDSGIMPPDIKGAQSYQRYFTEISLSDALASLLLLH